MVMLVYQRVNSPDLHLPKSLIIFDQPASTATQLPCCRWHALLEDVPDNGLELGRLKTEGVN
jgi:hypothetical protein